MSLVVVSAGPAATIQDLGRPGLRALGVAPSGAADPQTMRIVNRLVGNPESAAVIEVALGGLRLRAERATTVCVGGAEVDVTVDGRAVDRWAAIPVDAGAEVALGLAHRGARAYLAVRGGLVTAPVLGSRSTDTMSGLGPAPLTQGEILPVGPAIRPVPPNDIAPWRVIGDDVSLRVRPGPRRDMFTDGAWRSLTEAEWTVSTDADRIGARLDGPVLDRADTSELPSEGMVVGALQVPPHGSPVILLPDGPVTGGYPVIAVVAAADRALLGQLRPGARVRLRG